jgi:hypothetical protein
VEERGKQHALSPYVVIARFGRRYIDANRSARCAYSHPGAQICYNRYHFFIANYLSEVLHQNAQHGFLFDIHGTREIAEDPADVYLGTANGGSLHGLDRKSLFDQHGLHGLLKAVRRADSDAVQSYRVSPADFDTTETGQVNGGFTVRHYGERIPSIQIEIETALRTNAAKRALFIEDLAFAILNFVRRHAPF